MMRRVLAVPFVLVWHHGGGAAVQEVRCHNARWNWFRKHFSNGASEVEVRQPHTADGDGNLVASPSYSLTLNSTQPDEEIVISYGYFQEGFEPRFGEREVVDGRLRFFYGPYTSLNFTPGGYQMQHFEHALATGTASLSGAPYVTWEMAVIQDGAKQQGAGFYATRGNDTFALNRLTTMSGSSTGSPPANHSTMDPTSRGVEEVRYASWQGTRTRKYPNCSVASEPLDGISLPLPDYAFSGGLFMWAPLVVRKDGDFEFAVGWQSSPALFERVVMVYQQGQQQEIVHDVLHAGKHVTRHISSSMRSSYPGGVVALASVLAVTLVAALTRQH